MIEIQVIKSTCELMHSAGCLSIRAYLSQLIKEQPFLKTGMIRYIPQIIPKLTQRLFIISFPCLLGLCLYANSPKCRQDISFDLKKVCLHLGTLFN